MLLHFGQLVEEIKPVTFPRWSFGGWKSLCIIFSIAAWLELTVWAGAETMLADGAERWFWATFFFFLLLPPFWILFFRFGWVFAFFRSVQVGIINLCLIGLGSILGVLFHQEDPSFPIPRGGVERLADWEEPSFPSPWPVESRIAYRNFLDFRSAHAFSGWHMASAVGLRGWIGLPPGTADLDAMVAERVGILDQRLPELHERFGEEFAVALRTKSETGLRARERNREIRELESLHNDFWWSLFVWSSRFDLIRVYRSEWFAAFWAILFFGVLSNTFRGGWRRLLRPAKWGFVLTHTGILMVVVGGFHGRLTEMRGILELHVDESRGYFQQWDGREAFFKDPSADGLDTSFLVRLDAFRADYHDVLEVLYLKQKAEGGGKFEFPLDRQPRARVFEGLERSYDWGIDSSGARVPFFKVKVEKFLPQAKAEPTLTPVAWDDPSGIPLAWLAWEGESGLEEQVEVLPGRLGDPGTSHAESGTRIRYRLVEGAEQAKSLLASLPIRRIGVLAGFGEDGRQVSLDAAPGAVGDFFADGRPFKVRIVSGRPDVELVPDGAGGRREVVQSVPIDMAPLRNPGIRIEVKSPSGELADRWVLEDEFQNEGVRFPELKLNFHWDLWSAPARSKLTIFRYRDESTWIGEQGSPESLRELQAGELVALGRSSEFSLREAMGPTKVDLDFQPLPSADFFNPAPAAAIVRVETPNQDQVITLSAEPGSPFQESQFRYVGPDGEDRWVVLVL
ncbi:MAG TPA: hypothetical protein DDW23_07715, partial [Planctomycetes bacterium]|nr:hypothetical protein [Planctomycetota bacterium]